MLRGLPGEEAHAGGVPSAFGIAGSSRVSDERISARIPRRVRAHVFLLARIASGARQGHRTSAGEARKEVCSVRHSSTSRQVVQHLPVDRADPSLPAGRERGLPVRQGGLAEENECRHPRDDQRNLPARLRVSETLVAPAGEVERKLHLGPVAGRQTLQTGNHLSP